VFSGSQKVGEVDNMKRKIIVVFLMTLNILFMMLIPANVLTLGKESADPLGGGGDVEPLGTIGWKTLGSTWEPVVVEANQLMDLVGTPVNNTDVFSQDNDILIYAWDGFSEMWKQIPFQVDERSPINGSYLENFTNGVLDGYDEIVFMAQDGGDRASSDEWVIGCGAPRYEMEIVDPDTGDKAWAYIYKSSKIEASFLEDYVRFDTSVNDVFTDSYTMGFRDGFGMVMDYLNVTEAYGGDGEDLVDTLETEAVVWYMGFPFPFDENYFAEDFTLKKDGYVRALGVVSWHLYENLIEIVVDSYFNFTWKFYPKHVNSTGYIDIFIEGNVTVDISMALDHISSSIPMNYRDLGGNTAVINGVSDDSIIDLNFQGWWEVSSPHGGYVCVWNIELLSQLKRLRFDDDAALPDHANAEPGAYGKTYGYWYNISHEQIGFGNISFFPLPSNVAGVAEGISYNVSNPLLIIATSQHSSTIWVEKGVDLSSAKEGDFVNYTIFFNNTGDLNANYVWVNDSLPVEVTFVGHDANTLPYFISFSQIGNLLKFEFQNVPVGVHYFNIWVMVNSNAIFGLTVTNWVYCNFTNDAIVMMPESIGSASFVAIIFDYIILKQGWNLISIPVIQNDQSLTKVLENISGYYDAVQSYNKSYSADPWKHYKVGKPYGNDLVDINEKMGFWIHITEPGDTLFFYNGTKPTVNQTIDLLPGWNLMGYPSPTTYNRTQGLNNLTFDIDVDSIWTYNAETQKWEELGETDYFEPGRGYWVHAKTICIWEVPL
jgi:uncharacterized repeat protein (TIGR01451 family)